MPIAAKNKRKLIIGMVVENPSMSLYKAMRAVGYSDSSARQPAKTLGKSFYERIDEVLSDDKLIQVHDKLLNSTRVDHMVFPLYNNPEANIPLEGDIPEGMQPLSNGEATGLTDQDIIDMLAEVNCTVRRIVHGEQARHVYFWVSNDKARADALKLAYDIKGKLAKPEAPKADVYNTFIQNNTLDPNAPSAKQLVEASLKAMMEATKRKKVIDVQPEEPIEAAE